MGWGDRKLMLTILATITLVFMRADVQAQSQTVYAGLRASSYGFDNFPTPEWLCNAAKNQALRFKATPCVIWITAGMDEGTTERFLTYFDGNGVKAFIQVEPHQDDIVQMITYNLSKFKSHSCVIGFGVDVEYNKEGPSNDNLGEKVTDSQARTWSEKVRSYNPNYMLFMKHFFPEYMPPTYRDGCIFLSDSQQFPSLERFLNETDPKTEWGVGYKSWAKAATTAPSAIQYGYPDDEGWWGDYQDPQKTVGDSCYLGTTNTRYLFWVDFTAQQVKWDWKTGTQYTVAPKKQSLRMARNKNAFTIMRPDAFQNADIDVSLFDLKGKVVLLNRYSRNSTIVMNLNQSIAKGSYLLTLKADNKAILTDKVTVH